MAIKMAVQTTVRKAIKMTIQMANQMTKYDDPNIIQINIQMNSFKAVGL